MTGIELTRFPLQVHAGLRGALDFYTDETTHWLVVVPPLCMSRTFKKLAKIGAVLTVQQGKVHVENYRGVLVMTRSETSRCLSAYNKKVRSCLGIKKRLLLHSTGLNKNMSFEEVLQTLLKRFKEGLWVDKHFCPVAMLLKNANITNFEEIDMDRDSGLRALKEMLAITDLPHEKSTAEVTKDPFFPDGRQIKLLELFIDEVAGFT